MSNYIRKSWFVFFLFYFFTVSIQAQNNVQYNEMRYISCGYEGTLNKSFINKRILFLKGNDSIFFNVKIPFNPKEPTIYDSGLFYNCALKKDSLYSFELKRSFASEISTESNSYYLTNGVFLSNRDSKFKEIKRNTPYKYQGGNVIFIDIEGELYSILKMSPTRDCVFRH